MSSTIHKNPLYGFHSRNCSIRPVLFVLILAGVLTATSSGEEVLLTSGEKLSGNLASVLGGVTVTRGKAVRVVSWSEIDWIRLRTRRFVILSRVIPEKARIYSEAFEKFARALTSTFKFKPPMRNNWTTQIRIFRDRRRFNEFRRPGGGESASCGFFRVDRQSRVEEVVVLDIARDPGETFDTLLHEGTHLLLHLWGKAKSFTFPMWINEGMAEYFGGSSYRPGARSIKRVFTQGIQKPWHLLQMKQMLKKDEVEPLEDLVFLDGVNFQSRHYAQVWSFIHFLAHYQDGRYAARLHRFCRDLRRTIREGDRYIKLIEKTFKIKLPELEIQWREYVKDLKPATVVDGLALAEAYIYRGDYDPAIETLEQLLNRDHDDYRALVLKARALHGKDKYKKAHVLLDRAVKQQADYQPAMVARANLYYFEDRWGLSLKFYLRYYERSPLDLVAGLDYMRCLLEAPPKFRDFKRARSVGEAILEYHRDAELLVYIGDAELKLKNLADAILRYKEAAELSPKNPIIEKRLKKAQALVYK